MAWREHNWLGQASGALALTLTSGYTASAEVTIAGANFAGVTSVLFGDRPAPRFR